MCDGKAELVCDRTAAAIKLENEGELITITVAALAAGASTTPVNLSAIPLWRSIRLTYFAISGFAVDAAAVTLNISNIKQGGPWLGGELSSTNGNACAAWSCEKGYCAGPIETANVVVKNMTGAPISGTVTIRVMYAFQGDPGFDADMAACGCPVKQGNSLGGFTPACPVNGGGGALPPVP